MDNLPPDYRFVLFISQHYYRSGSIILTIKCDAVVVSNGSLISANDTTPVRDDATALAMIKPRKHRWVADSLLQSAGVLTRYIRVYLYY